MKTSELTLDVRQRALRDANGRVYDLATREWRADDATVSGRRVSAPDAVRWLQRDSGHPRREPVSVIGGRHASLDELDKAHALGAALAKMGCVVLCGGRGGVMRAVCEGVASEGGISVGLLPGDTIAEANDAVTIPIATGIGFARNAIIARAALCIVAIGGSYGTLSELAYGMHYGKPVFALRGTPAVDGVESVGSVEAAADAVARVALGLHRRVKTADALAGDG
jgi:uncharacterized protein (TIGR00725 family)